MRTARGQERGSTNVIERHVQGDKKHRRQRHNGRILVNVKVREIVGLQ